MRVHNQGFLFVRMQITQARFEEQRASVVNDPHHLTRLGSRQPRSGMLSTRQQLAFSSKPFSLITGKLSKQTVPEGALPCKHLSAFEKRIRSKWRRFLVMEDFDDLITSFDDHVAVKESLDMYKTEELAPLWFTKEDMMDMMPQPELSRRAHLKHLQKREVLIAHKMHANYHHHRHFHQRVPNLGNVYDESGQVFYGMYNNTIVSVIEYSKSRSLSRLVSAALFGQRLVIDFPYDHLMLCKQFASLASQISILHAYNLKSRDPFDICFSGFQSNRQFMASFKKTAHTDPDKLMISVYPEPLETVFPVKSLIYLSPHSPEVMEHFDPDAVYVLGALVDTFRSDITENSYQRARDRGIRSQRLPVLVKDRNNAPPRLPVSAVGNMLVDMRNEGISVEEAMNRHISRKKMGPPLAVVRKQMMLQQEALAIESETENESGNNMMMHGF